MAGLVLVKYWFGWHSMGHILAVAVAVAGLVWVKRHGMGEILAVVGLVRVKYSLWPA